ncbi:MAG: SAP domain-containing protein [Methylococcales bacterium]|jgi:hypothetical protein|nr:SAP domain-containing protein [Methylococcales bacterium]MBT7443058.1 SAP domain-containing protein [Methylococcales bacterium]
MNMQQIRKIAKGMDLNTTKIKKLDLIRSIQTEEGNNACFNTASDGQCDQTNCLWREDCLNPKTAGKKNTKH